MLQINSLIRRLLKTLAFMISPKSRFSHHGNKNRVGHHWFYKMEYNYILSVYHGQ